MGQSRSEDSIVGHKSVSSFSATGSVHTWLTGENLPRVRSLLLGLTLFVGLVIWVAFTLGLVPQGSHLVDRLRVLGVMTWMYALVQILDLKLWHSRFVRRRRESSRIPEALEGWLLGQMFAWFGIAYYALTDDPSWYVAGLVLFLLSFLLFPIADER